MENIQVWLKPSLIWFVIGLICLILEFTLPGVILVFFGLGAWVVAGISLILDLSINLQLLIFILTSVLMLVLLREKFQSLFRIEVNTNTDEDIDVTEFIGQRAVVTQPITPKTAGRVEFRGTYWKAQASENIPKNTPVEIIEKNNITLVVKPL